MTAATGLLDYLDADEIVPQLWQGSVPRGGKYLSEHGFDCVVLCAYENQDASRYHDIDVILAPNDDNYRRPPTNEEMVIAMSAAGEVAKRLERGENVLVTCMQGRNRSGLVSALTLHYWKGYSGVDATRLVQERRLTALQNPGFVAALKRFKGTTPAPPPVRRFVLPR